MRAYDFDEGAGDGIWRVVVRDFDGAQRAYSKALEDSGPRLPPPPRPSGPVVKLDAWRAVRAAEADPVEEAANAYQRAALRLLSTWAPNSGELREQMRLAAEMAGLPDPQRGGLWRREVQDIEPTAANVLELLFAATYGLIQAERQARQGRK